MNDERAGFHALMQRMDIGRQGSRRSDGFGRTPNLWERTWPERHSDEGVGSLDIDGE
jgi:hypothetical protein